MDTKNKIAAAIVTFIIVATMLVSSALSGATELCTFSHKLDMNMSCGVEATEGEFRLVKHVDIDVATTEFSVHRGSKIVWESQVFQRGDSDPQAFLVKGPPLKVVLNGTPSSIE